MQGICILLLAVHITFSCAALTSPRTYHEEKMYGDQLSIRLKGADKLQFTSMDETVQDVLWSRFQATKRGTITGREDDKTFVIHSVNFEDQGTYTAVNFWNKNTAICYLKVITKMSFHDCVAGEKFTIPLGNLLKHDATLKFSSQDLNLTLVDHGSLVGNTHSEYMGRIRMASNGIEVLNVNVSDVGSYTLSDRLGRKVRILFMNLVDHHPPNNGALAALLLLLGIPPCICCCCRKRICKKNTQSTTTATSHNVAMKLDNQENPCGPPPAYVYPAQPAGPTPGYSPGYPAVGGETVHPPPNPTFPPQPAYNGYPATSPAMPPNPTCNPEYNNQNPLYPPPSGFPPAQSPQWSGTPYNQPTPAGFAPVMYSAPPAPGGEITAATPLVSPPQGSTVQYTGNDVLHSSDSAIQFNIGSGNGSNTKFL